MAGKSGAKKRPVYVNGVYCESLSAAAREASRVLKREIQLWQVHRAVIGRKKIAGLRIEELLPEKKPKQANEKKIPQQRSALDMGIPSVYW